MRLCDRYMLIVTPKISLEGQAGSNGHHRHETVIIVGFSVDRARLGATVIIVMKRSLS